MPSPEHDSLVDALRAPPAFGCGDDDVAQINVAETRAHGIFVKRPR